MKFNVVGSFCGNIIGPLDTHVIVIVEDGGGVNVGKSVAHVGDTAREIAEVNDFLQGCISGTYLGLTGAMWPTSETLQEILRKSTTFFKVA